MDWFRAVRLLSTRCVEQRNARPVPSGAIATHCYMLAIHGSCICLGAASEKDLGLTQKPSAVAAIRQDGEMLKPKLSRLRR
eukprot:scaffold77063_cov20-Tisochrysis_lutea.AAC.1